MSEIGEAQPRLTSFKDVAIGLGFAPYSTDPKIIYGPERTFVRPLPTLLVQRANHSVPISAEATVTAADCPMKDGKKGEEHYVGVCLNDSPTWSVENSVLGVLEHLDLDERHALIQVLGDGEQGRFDKKALKKNGYEKLISALKVFVNTDYFEGKAQSLLALLQHAIDVSDTCLKPEMPNLLPGFSGFIDTVEDNGEVIFYKPGSGKNDQVQGVSFNLMNPDRVLVQVATLDPQNPASFYRLRSSASKQWPYIVAPKLHERPAGKELTPSWHYDPDDLASLRVLLPRIAERVTEDLVI